MQRREDARWEWTPGTYVTPDDQGHPSKTNNKKKQNKNDLKKTTQQHCLCKGDKRERSLKHSEDTGPQRKVAGVGVAENRRGWSPKGVTGAGGFHGSVGRGTVGRGIVGAGLWLLAAPAQTLMTGLARGTGYMTGPQCHLLRLRSPYSQIKKLKNEGRKGEG